MDDASFLQAIFDAPDDVATRLVYADWLEERGDIRGELLRARAALAGMAARARGRKELAEHERELVGRCDERWLVLLERAEWRKLCDELEPTGKHRPRWKPDKQAAIGAALAAFEADLGVRLPRSYKAFAHVFGTGEWAGLVFIESPDLADPGSLARFNRLCHENVARYHGGPDEFLAQAVFLGVTHDGDSIVLDPGDITDTSGMEGRIHWLDLGFDIYRTADSFRQFITDIRVSRHAVRRGPGAPVFAPHDP